MAVDLHSAAIRSRQRFTYEEVDDYLADRQKWQDQAPPEVFELLARMHELAMMLRARRLHAAALELSLDEVKVDLDKQGRVVGAHKVQNTESHQIIEEFMLSANEAVAERWHQAELLFLRRVHQAPDPRKLKALTEFVKELGLPDRQPGKPVRDSAAPLRGGGQAGTAGGELRDASQPEPRPSTVRKTKGITPWPAIAIAISLRRFAAIPT